MKENKTWLHSGDEDEDVTASEVAAYTYCAKAWHLERVLGRSVDSATMSRRSSGADRHLAHGARVSRLSRFGRVAVWASGALFAIAAVLLAAALLW
jgi:hypothetical protein